MINAHSMGLPDGFKTAQILLKQGVGRSSIDHAMRKAFSSTGSISKDEVDLFLSHGADANTANGNYFIQAALKEDMDLFQMLVNSQPDAAIVIPALIQSVRSEKVLVRFLQCLVNSVSPSHVSIGATTLCLAMERFPRGKGLVRLLLDLGLASSSTTATTINAALGPENVSPLVWALLRENPRVSDAVLVAMLQAGNGGGHSYLSPLNINPS
jgi:hypothetical protein